MKKSDDTNLIKLKHTRLYSHRLSVVVFFQLLSALSGGLFLAYGQAPGLVWKLPVNAKFFAIDGQTNLYANTGGTVKVLNSSGVLISSNLFCPVTGPGATVAQRDAQGNYWFFGNFDGTNNFGGTVLVGGWTNGPVPPGHWVAGYPTCFLAEYSSNGVLQFVTSFGQQAQQNNPMDLLLDPAGGAYLGYTSGQDTHYSHFTAAGSNEWTFSYMYAFGLAGTLGGVTTSNCILFEYDFGPNFRTARLDRSGTSTGFFGGEGLSYSNQTITNGRPVLDDAANVFQAALCNNSCPSPAILHKISVANNQEVWLVPLGSEEQFTLARDPLGNLYLGGFAGTFSEYSTDGAQIWSTNYGPVVTRMLVHSSGTRFLAFQDGDFARMADQAAPQLPAITNNPSSQTVFVGDPILLSVEADGTQPINYYWKLNTTNSLISTSNRLVLAAASLQDAGYYSVIVSNPAGSVTSAPALLRVKQVELYAGSQLLSNGDYVFPTPPTLSVHSVFSGGSIFYTLDGSTPDFSTIAYSGPFTLTNSAFVRAIGYSADFSQSEQADQVNATVLPDHTLTAASTGGGNVTLNPPGGTYSSTNVVTATAVPGPGWSFMGWQGDASGNSPTISVTMERDKSIFAVFGTSLSTSEVGNGQIQLYPPAGPYAYGSVVRLTGVPQPGSYFGAWGNAASGNTNPLYFSILAPTQTVSSIFGALAANQSALTVLIAGAGTVTANPRANVFATNQSVVLTATPANGQAFINWTGDASGTQNPITLPMTQSRVVTANFSAPGLFVDPTAGDGLSASGFTFSVVSAPQAWQIYSSSNLNNWDLIRTITNTQGRLRFTDSTATNASRRFYKATTP
jgi:hypothetical protein